LSNSKVKLVVAYDGTDFRGWAAQTGQRTVQCTLKESVRRVSGEECEIVGASRTDSGAHARGQVCHFEPTVGPPAANWADVLNRVLPQDVVVRSASAVPQRFHSRFCALDRWYRYRILLGSGDPERNRYTHACNRPLDESAMHGAAQVLVGTHDFLSLAEEIASGANTVRTVLAAKVHRTRDEVRIDVVGEAFLRGMMRRIAGALLDVGLGKRQSEDVRRLLQTPSIGPWPAVLPAKGLTLMRVRYGRTLRDIRDERKTESLNDRGSNDDLQLDE